MPYKDPEKRKAAASRRYQQRRLVQDPHWFEAQEARRARVAAEKADPKLRNQRRQARRSNRLATDHEYAAQERARIVREREEYKARLRSDPLYKEAYNAKRREYVQGRCKSDLDFLARKRAYGPKYRIKRKLADPAKERAKDRHQSRRKRGVRITQAEFDAQLQNQASKCGICANLVTEGGARKTRACADHCHVSLRFRGILCATCNVALSFFDDDHRRMRRAVHWVQQVYKPSKDLSLYPLKMRAHVKINGAYPRLLQAVFWEALKRQSGKCGVCRIVVHEPSPVASTRACADHRHSGGLEFRGVLCARCNVGLGLFRDDPLRLVAAAKWVQPARCSPRCSPPL